MGFVSFFKNWDNNANIKKLKKIVEKINALEEKYSLLDDATLASQTQILKDRLNTEKEMDVLPDAFAVVREASKRVLNMRHFDVQLMGGICLYQGRIAEMKTGEGKTLVATLACYFAALKGQGVHVVTVNEFLAKTQAEQMAKLYNFLGLTVGINLSGMSPAAKKKAYDADITYTTNNELGFDYLRDNMVTDKRARVQRGQIFAIVDEVDSILIDEARTPLIISGQGFKPADNYLSAQAFFNTLKPEHYDYDEEKKRVSLTEAGIEKAEKFFKIEDLSDISNLELNHYINNALRANIVMKADRDYIVQDKEILIVDEFTGRIMQGRRYSEGLHQAIEAKEGVEIKNENKTLATITFQNYFRLYKKLSGMTGTAKTEETEFNKIYNLDVVCIPTNLPIKRKDENDKIFKSVQGKVQAIIQDIKACYEKGQPVLVGTVSVEKSEELSKALKGQRIPHYVLNAKNHAQESEIVAQAGRYKAVTISTNMAGRGTDILLGGNPEFLAKRRLREIGYEEEQILQATAYIAPTDEELLKIRSEYEKLYKEFKIKTDAEKIKVVEAGGLRVIGTERHESRRIDNQLRGRSGRQGDVGSSVFYISLQDDLIRIFGGDKLYNIANMCGINDNEEFSLKMVTNAIENAQKKIEVNNFGMRKNVIMFDDVLNKQRELIYNERNKVLEGNSVTADIEDMFKEQANFFAYEYLDEDKPFFDWKLEPINKALETNLLPKGTNLINEKTVEDKEIQEVAEFIFNHLITEYNAKKAESKEKGFPFEWFEKALLLRQVDFYWTNHIDTMNILKNEIITRGFGGQDPIVAYKKEAFDMFDEMISNIRTEVVRMLFCAKVEVKIEQVQPTPKPIVIKEGIKSNAKADNKPNRNDACPCGSGKKYKNCCGKDE